MRKYGACLAALAAVMLVGPAALAAAQTRHGKADQTRQKHAKKSNKDFIVLGRHHARVSLYIQRGHRSPSARAAACQAGGPYSPNYCSPPVEQNLFGAYAWNDGGVTFGSTSSSTCRGLGWSSAPCGVYTTVANTLIVAFVGGDGPSGVQSLTVSCKLASGGTCPVTFKKVNSENKAGGDSEVWYADATNVISQSNPIFVTATASTATCGSGHAACDVSLQAVTFANAIASNATGGQATGIGNSNACYSTSGAPTCPVTTSESDSQVWGALNNPKSAQIPTWPSNQYAVGVADGANQKTFYSQFLGTCTANANGSKPCTPMPLPASGLYQNPFALAPASAGTAGTNVTINDTAPANNPFNEVVVEIL